jgi:DNA polymerase-3 subunit epsilon
VPDAEFMVNVNGVIGGTGIEEFTDATVHGDQFALF